MENSELTKKIEWQNLQIAKYEERERKMLQAKVKLAAKNEQSEARERNKNLKKIDRKLQEIAEEKNLQSRRTLPSWRIDENEEAKKQLQKQRKEIKAAQKAAKDKRTETEAEIRQLKATKKAANKAADNEARERNVNLKIINEKLQEIAKEKHVAKKSLLTLPTWAINENLLEIKQNLDNLEIAENQLQKQKEEIKAAKQAAKNGAGTNDVLHNQNGQSDFISEPGCSSEDIKMEIKREVQEEAKTEGFVKGSRQWQEQQRIKNRSKQRIEDLKQKERVGLSQCELLLID